MTGRGEGASGGDQSASPSISGRRLLTIVAFGVAGGTVAGTVVGALAREKAGDVGTWQLEPVPTSALYQIQGTLASEEAGQLVEEARRCRTAGAGCRQAQRQHTRRHGQYRE